MSEIDCVEVQRALAETVHGCASWVELGRQLTPDFQQHLSGCASCRSCALQFLEVERGLRGLPLEPLPQLDLTAAIMARLEPAPAGQPAAWRAWAPLLLLGILLVPEPAGLGQWLAAVQAWAWGLSWLSVSWPQWTVGAGLADFLWVAVTVLLFATTWKWRHTSHA